VELTEVERLRATQRQVWAALAAVEDLEDRLVTLTGVEAAEGGQPISERVARLIGTGAAARITRSQLAKAGTAAERASDALGELAQTVTAAPEIAAPHTTWGERVTIEASRKQKVNELTGVLNEVRAAAGELTRCRMQLDLELMRADNG
jgi:hypothetical protein